MTIRRQPSRLSLEEQIARFGVSYDEAMDIRDSVQSKLSPKEIKAARAAYTSLFEELRPQQDKIEAHPEAIRFRMLSALNNGLTIEEASAVARAFALGEKQ